MQCQVRCLVFICTHAHNRLSHLGSSTVSRPLLQRFRCIDETRSTTRKARRQRRRPQTVRGSFFVVTVPIQVYRRFRIYLSSSLVSLTVPTRISSFRLLIFASACQPDCPPLSTENSILVPPRSRRIDESLVHFRSFEHSQSICNGNIDTHRFPLPNLVSR